MGWAGPAVVDDVLDGGAFGLLFWSVPAVAFDGDFDVGCGDGFVLDEEGGLGGLGDEDEERGEEKAALLVGSALVEGCFRLEDVLGASSLLLDTPPALLASCSVGMGDDENGWGFFGGGGRAGVSSGLDVV